MWKESDHPRAKDGKFTDGTNSSTTNDKTSTSKTSHTLAIDTPEAQQLRDAIANNQRYTYEQLMAHPTVQDFERQRRRGEIAKKSKKPMTEEEKQRHVTKFLEGAQSAPRGFRADIVMGLPSAGKSTKVVNGLKSKYGSFEFDNDEIKKLLSGYDEYGASYVHDDSKTVQESAFSQFQKSGALNGANLAIPIVGSDAEKIQRDWINRLQAAGYEVHIHHVEISNKESQNRSVKRAIELGRYVPLGIIRDYRDKPKIAYEKLKQAQPKGVVFES